ncbi:hypothetical protein WP50_30455, partial [Lactiplantibacillus plantarum]
MKFEKRVVVVTSRDYPTDDAIMTALQRLTDTVSAQSFDDLLAAHEAGWADRWQQSDIQIEGDTEAQQGMRFNLFELFSTYYGDDPRLNIGPKGFTGEKYGGATYWDTEAFAVPVYLGITKPEVTRNLLMYRYKQLDGAYHNARQQGLDGALFPMVTFNGIECHNEWEITFEEIHRNGDIAFAIYNYTEKRVVVVTSRDYPTDDAIMTALQRLTDTVSAQSFDDLLAAHEAGWADRWQQSDIQIEGDTEAQQGMRFNLFELFSTYYGDDPRLNIGPKGFTGEKYGGATYWDTEAFAVPVYLGITKPEVTRNLLMFSFEKRVVVVTSRDYPTDDAIMTALQRLTDTV